MDGCAVCAEVASSFVSRTILKRGEAPHCSSPWVVLGPLWMMWRWDPSSLCCKE